MKNKNQFEVLGRKIIESKKIIIFHHTRPDGDCLGAAFGLQSLLKTNFPKKEILVFGNAHGHFPFLNFDFADHRVIQDFSDYLAIIVDVNNPERIELSEILLNYQFAAMIRFDHHNHASSLPLFAELDDPNYASCCELLVDFALTMNWVINARTATLFYLGIFTDTGGMTFPSVKTKTMEAVLTCWQQGADKDLIHSELKKRSLQELKIQSEILNNFKTKGGVIYYYMDLATQKKLGIDSPLLANFPNMLGNIEHYPIWIYFTQEQENAIRTEFRSKGYDVKKLATTWKGGGHVNASGCLLDHPDKIALVVEDAAKILQEK
ncbi:phosphoesterase RecJ-like protein [Mycoplasmoides fastidiosum]|uniref:Phosphoesterase RecJ-like protein n=1 Tax=Mycoplasmoides fastidiosum TaxID=92758 RepID=A0ABU0LYL5_9BACT|nr:bifunctional oligoribonuclease/PAP phosphatase NrnA [Mycoplasmoides fastidiosum]MDQ0513801.1 phosphoesterase RecJ-like protein [Mycoplasmoides fastidiosum]UUD37781.1 bifunctional oligoribonuclease/PAP phosphatase NrnA [Mycoplasmoides fastidiosum]